ncbi:MAG: DUF1559 domain-containing protein [Pirellulales bacterium]
MIRRRASIVLLALSCFVCRGAVGTAEDSPVAPLLFDDAFLVARVNLEKVQVQPLYELLDRTIGSFELPSQRAVETFVSKLRDGGAKEVYLVWGGETGILFVPHADGTKTTAVEDALMAHPLSRLLPVEATARLAGGVVGGRPTMLTHLRDQKPAPRPHLVAALEATSDCTLQLLLLPTDGNRRQTAGFIWPMLQFAATSTAMERIAWGSIGIDGPQQPRMKMVFEAKDAESVEPLQAALGQTIEPLLNHPAVHQNLALVEILRAIFAWQRTGNTLSLDIDDRRGKLTVVARGMIQPVLDVTIGASASREAMNHLKQIGIAFQNHHDVYRRFPAPAILDAQGKPLLSWRVAILPYIDDGALYKKFHLDEPWDSPHNKPLLDEMPDVYRCPLAKVADDHTVFLVPRGEGSAFGGSTGIQIRQIIDGTSKTIATVEVDDEHAVPWTKPDDWQYDPDQPTAGLGGHFPDVFLSGGCDASVHAVSLSIDPDLMRALITYSGREPVAFPQ